MPPRVHLVRHAQGSHNATHNYQLRDPTLTKLGKDQCRALSLAFLYHKEVNVVFASPLRRTIQTAALGLGPALSREDVPFVLHPFLQEVSDAGCDIGIADMAEDLELLLPALFAEDNLSFDIRKIDISRVTKGWNTKRGRWAYERSAISKRTAEFRNWLFKQREARVRSSLPTYIHCTNEINTGRSGYPRRNSPFLTEDWDVEDPMIGTAYENCEHREFVFTSDSTAGDAQLIETGKSRARRGPKEPESDPHVRDEMLSMQKEVIGQEGQI